MKIHYLSFLLIGLLSIFEVACSQKEAKEMRYVKSIVSENRTIEFTYDPQYFLISATERDGNVISKYTFARQGYTTRIERDGRKLAVLRPESSTYVKIDEQLGNILTSAEYVMDNDRRIQKSNIFSEGIVNYNWQDGDLQQIKSQFSEYSYTYGKLKTPPTNIDIMNCITVLPYYMWYYCVDDWGQTTHLMESAQNFIYTTSYSYEFDNEGYISQVTEHVLFDGDFETYEEDKVYKVTYYE